MARVDKNSSIKPFFDDSAEGINQLPAFLTAPKKPNVLEEAVELVSSSFAKAGLTTGPLNIAATSDEERVRLREQDKANQQTLKDYENRIDEINKFIPQRRQPELKKLYDEIRANTNFDPLTLGDRFNQLRGFFFNDTAAIHNKVARGEVRVSDLRGDDLVNYLFGIVDTVDLATLGISTVVTGPLRLAVKAFRAGKIDEAQKLLKQADETGELEKTSDTIIKARLGRNKQGRSPEVYFGLSGNKGFLSEAKRDDLFKLAEIINNTPKEKLTSTLTGLARDNKLDSLLVEKGKKINPLVISSFDRYGDFLKIDKNKITQLSDNAKTQRYKGGPEKYDEVKNALNQFIKKGKDFEYQKDLGEALGFTQANFENFLARNPDLKELKNKIVTFDPTTGTGNAAKNLFIKESAEIFTKKKELNELFLQVDQGLKDGFETNYFEQINTLRKEAGIKEDVTPFGLWQNYMYDKYRSIKGTTGNEKLSTTEFINKYMGDADIDNFQKYAKLELDRNKANSLGRKKLEELFQIPEYKPYLLNEDGNLNVTLLQFDKAHDIPLFVTRREGAGRLAKTGRFTGAGAEVELISPSLQIYNKLQYRLDPYLNNFVDIIKNKTQKTKFEKMSVKIHKGERTADKPIN